MMIDRNKPAINKPAINKPVINKTVIDKTVIDKTVIDKTEINRTAINEPAINMSATNKLAINEKEHALTNPYPSIQDDKGGKSFGGNQGWFERLRIRENGCGLIGAADLLLYVSATASMMPVLHAEACMKAKQNVKAKQKVKAMQNVKAKQNVKAMADARSESYTETVKGDRGKNRQLISREEYLTYAVALNRLFFPILPYFGMPGYVLSFGLNRCFRKYRLPYRAGWGVRPGRIFSAIEEMLDRNIPVILAIGPNIPFFWRRKNLTLYRKSQDGKMKAAQSVRGHYVSVTAVKGDYLLISSWGEPFYIRWSEYQNYIRNCSCPLFSNLCYIKEQGRCSN